MTFLVILFFALIHLYAEHINKFGFGFCSKLLSTGSGISIAYVFMDILPKLSSSDVLIKQVLWSFFPYLEKHVYIMALLGFLLFFVVDRLQQSLVTKRSEHQSPYFILSLGSYSLFNFLVGYAVVDKDNPEVQPLLLFTIAIGLHYFMNDYSLTRAHGDIYRHYGRWVLVLSLFLGWAAGFFIDLSASAVALLSAFIGGGVIMNVIRHELPEEGPNNLRAFLLATAGYTIILLAIGRN